jgi:poly(A) polymerase
VGSRLPLEPAIDPALPLLRQAASEMGVPAWAVGGYVRDLLLGRPHPDLDVVVESGLGPELAANFARLAGARPPVVFPRFGTAQVTWGDRMVEFVSARRESYASDSRKPQVEPATIEEDLRRRDFTINTLLMDLEGQIHDPMGGRLDLEQGLLRTPDSPVRTFSDDPLRMLRAVRFAAQLDFQLDPSLLPAMRQLRQRLRPPVLSIERVKDELCKMLTSARPSLAMELLEQGGLLEMVLPELAACRGVEQGGWHTHDVYGHTLLALSKISPDLRLRLAVLFHDVGKPRTAAGDGSFHGHAELGADMTREAMRRLRFPGDLTGQVSRLVQLHMRPIFYRSDWSEGAVRRMTRDAGGLVDQLLDVARADTLASAYPHPEELDDLERRVKEVLTEQPSRFRLPVSGHDIIRVRGVAPGPEVGRIKARLEELVLEEALPADREVILAYLEKHTDL